MLSAAASSDSSPTNADSCGNTIAQEITLIQDSPSHEEQGVVQCQPTQSGQILTQKKSAYSSLEASHSKFEDETIGETRTSQNATGKNLDSVPLNIPFNDLDASEVTNWTSASKGKETVVMQPKIHENVTSLHQGTETVVMQPKNEESFPDLSEGDDAVVLQPKNQGAGSGLNQESEAVVIQPKTNEGPSGLHLRPADDMEASILTLGSEATSPVDETTASADVPVLSPRGDGMGEALSR